MNFVSYALGFEDVTLDRGRSSLDQGRSSFQHKESETAEVSSYHQLMAALGRELESDSCSKFSLSDKTCSGFSRQDNPANAADSKPPHFDRSSELVDALGIGNEVERDRSQFSNGSETTWKEGLLHGNAAYEENLKFLHRGRKPCRFDAAAIKRRRAYADSKESGISRQRGRPRINPAKDHMVTDKPVSCNPRNVRRRILRMEKQCVNGLKTASFDDPLFCTALLQVSKTKYGKKKFSQLSEVISKAEEATKEKQ